MEQSIFNICFLYPVKSNWILDIWTITQEISDSLDDLLKICENLLVYVPDKKSSYSYLQSILNLLKMHWNLTSVPSTKKPDY